MVFICTEIYLDNKADTMPDPSNNGYYPVLLEYVGVGNIFSVPFVPFQVKSVVCSLSFRQ